jgi:hypothetical protein
MATYIGTTAKAKAPVSKIWFAVLAFALAAAIVVAIAMQSRSVPGYGVPTAPSSGLTDRQHTQSRLNETRIGAGSVGSGQTLTAPNRF